MKVIIQHSTGTSAEWNAVNPKLDVSVLAVEEMPDGSRRFKLGDGATRWRQLPYINTDNIAKAPGGEGSKTLTAVIAEIDAALAAEVSRAKNRENGIEAESKARDAAETARSKAEEGRIEAESRARDEAETARAKAEEGRIETESRARDEAETARALENEGRIEAESRARDAAHAALTTAHGSTAQPAKNRIAMFDNVRKLHTGNPATQSGDVVRYDEFYVFEKHLHDLEEAMPPLIVDREGNFIVSRGGLLLEAG